MKQRSGPSLGFSRLELAFILVLIALGGVLAITQYLDLSRTAEQSVETGVIEAVRKGISDYARDSREFGRLPIYPPQLDDAGTGEARARNRLFTYVVRYGLAVSGWTKTGQNQYQAPNRDIFIYDPETGSFATRVSDSVPSAPHAPETPTANFTGD